MKISTTARVAAPCFALALCACAPKVLSFTAAPRALCLGDSAVLNWTVRGTPHMAVRVTRPQSSDPAAPQELITLTLYAQRGSRVSPGFPLQLQRYADPGQEVVALTSLAGDTVVAEDTLSSVVWNDMPVRTVASGSGRSIEVRHAGRSLMIGPDSTPSTGLEGTPMAGVWQMRSILTPRELADRRSRPDRLRVGVTGRCMPR